MYRTSTNFDPTLIQNIVNQRAVEDHISRLSFKQTSDLEYQIASLLRAVTCIDLTTLSGDDCYSNVYRLCLKAIKPIEDDLLVSLGFTQDFHVGAVCVYPSQVAHCYKILQSFDSDVPVASVAAGFPSGQYRTDTRLTEIERCIEDGASEIDIVISRKLVICQQWEELYREVKDMRLLCGDKAHLKTILATGELGSLTNIYKASMICMMAGADFIKTSTGKESVNAVLPVGLVMARAIKDYYNATGIKVGFKPAGGIRTAKDVLVWQTLMKEELGFPYLFPDLFRIGASGLLGNIEQQVFRYIGGSHTSNHRFSYL